MRARVDLPEPEIPHVRRTVLLLGVASFNRDAMDFGRGVEVEGEAIVR